MILAKTLLQRIVEKIMIGCHAIHIIALSGNLSKNVAARTLEKSYDRCCIFRMVLAKTLLRKDCRKIMIGCHLHIVAFSGKLSKNVAARMLEKVMTGRQSICRIFRMVLVQTLLPGRMGKIYDGLPIHTVVFSGWFEQNRRWKDGGKYYDRKSYHNVVFLGWFEQKR